MTSQKSIEGIQRAVTNEPACSEQPGQQHSSPFPERQQKSTWVVVANAAPLTWQQPAYILSATSKGEKNVRRRKCSRNPPVQFGDPTKELMKPLGQELQPGAGLVAVPATDVLPTAHGEQSGPMPLPAGHTLTVEEGEHRRRETCLSCGKEDSCNPKWPAPDSTYHCKCPSPAVVQPAGQAVQGGAGVVMLPGADVLAMGHGPQVALRP